MGTDVGWRPRRLLRPRARLVAPTGSGGD